MKNPNFEPFLRQNLRKYWNIPDSTRSYWNTGQLKLQNYNRKVSKKDKKSQIQIWIKFFHQFWKSIFFGLLRKKYTHWNAPPLGHPQDLNILFRTFLFGDSKTWIPHHSETPFIFSVGWLWTFLRAFENQSGLQILNFFWVLSRVTT